MSTINKVEKDGVVYNIGGGLSRFISFDKHFKKFHFTEDIQDFSVVGQIAHARYTARTKTTRHGIGINSWTIHDAGNNGAVPDLARGEKYFRTCSRNNFSRINNDENYRFNAIPAEDQYDFEILDNIFKYWFVNYSI